MFPTLPVEIFLMVVENVSSVSDLRSLRAVNRALCNAATPAAFRTVGATNRHDSALGLVSLLESDLAQYVEEATYRDAAAGDGKKSSRGAADEDASYGPAVQDTLVRAFSGAARLPRLKSLRFTFHPTYPDSVLQNLHAGVFPTHTRHNACASVHLQHALIATVEGATPHLRSLALENVTSVHNAVYASSGFTAAISSITHLRLTTALHTSTAQASSASLPSTIFWFVSVHTYMLECAKNVVSLTLASDVRFLSPVVKWKVILLPRLKYLAVKISHTNIAWVTQRCKEDFVPRHGQLEWIDLGAGADKVWWIRHTHADPQDVSEYEIPPSVALEHTGN
ncbi:hypothetical protein FA95DRAFT_1574922 [Auriscalpium vulgare]|uniref:Uncharacterized protein n=1 Tax=Auriscalpium vulgare TaxID=40419 RepID=A0ACB8RJC2_9AGAM|nr:hypothetical protein FA95DRAFT_1574922 [Auriscalpium vulgare]